MGNTVSFSRIKIGEINVMENIWYRNPSKSDVIVCVAVKKKKHAESTV